MSADHWQAVEDLYTRAADLAGEERARLLDTRREEWPAVVAEVESLLAAEPGDERFLSTPWVSGGPARGIASPQAGRAIGRFRLLRPIGAGGTGAVYLSEREDAGFTQQVAIKIVTAARWQVASLRLFRAERQVLATLHHPHIVTLIDSGLTDDGLAYLVMEYVEGVPLTTYCQERRLDVRARLQLFQQVCGAVQYAHRHSIVHRDLKPANILVTADGVPKVLDFGIARLVAGPGTGVQQTTAAWLRALTPNYASPEQVRGLPASTADDVYALGVILYELLTGQVPHEQRANHWTRCCASSPNGPPPGLHRRWTPPPAPCEARTSAPTSTPSF